MIFPRLLFITYAMLMSTVAADVPATPPPTPTSYLGGWCHFDLQLFQDCHLTPNNSYQIRTLGNIFAINDYRNNPIATYPEGAGWIDAYHAIPLSNMPGLSYGLWIIYDTDNVTYFRFGSSSWNDSTVAKVNMTGWVHPEPWTNPDLQCEDGNIRYYRFRNMAGGFAC